MKISPIDIRQHTFEKGFRGYDIDDVNAFLNSLSQEWERVMNENKMLKMQLEIAEKELNKLRDVEMTLFRTLKTAEDTSTQITEQANKAAEKYLEESRRKTDEAISDTKRKASMIVQDAENEAKYIREEIINELKNQERDFKAMEKYRDNVVVQLKSLVSNTNETVERFEKKFSEDSSFTQKMEEIKQQVTDAAALPTQAEVEASIENQEMESDDKSLEASGKVEANIDHTSAGSMTTADAAGSDGEPSDADSENQEEADADDAADRVAASDALAEVERMTQARKAAEELEMDEEENEGEAPTQKNAKDKGSFFDQIG